MRIILPRYLNCEPIRITLRRSLSNIEILDIEPSKTLEEILVRKPELCMIPIPYISENILNQYSISEVCIASRGPVKSVGIYYKDSINPIDIDQIYSTEESATSIRILKHIFKTRYNKDIIIKRVKISRKNLDEIVRKIPTFLIGDLALEAYYKYRIILDVGEEWYKIYNIPLIYAVLTYKKDNKKALALTYSLENVLENPENIKKIIREIDNYLKRIIPLDLIQEYLTHNIVYVVELETLKEVIEIEKDIINNITL